MQIKLRPVTPESESADLGEIDPLLERIYRARGVRSRSQLNRQLSALPVPHSLLGLEAALQLLTEALTQQQKIVVVGDFDADGATSCALMLLAMKAMGLKHIDFLVPNRFDYGYGLTPEIVDLAGGLSPDLIVTVDNGISSLDGVQAAREKGIRVLITDHHLPGESLPSANAIVNPNQPGCPFPGKNLAGVGVVFYLLTALRARLRERNWFDSAGIAEPNMAAWLDLVALGTVADVVPLDHINRILVHQGLQRIRTGQCRPGITALIDVAGRNAGRMQATDLGFVVGPRLNAAGRLDDMTMGIDCLLTESPELAREYALQLDELNRDRRQIEQGMQQEGEAMVGRLRLTESDALPWGLCLYESGWHQGVVGLLASRIKEKLHRPVIAFANESADGTGDTLKGSARSIPGFHIRDALDAIAARCPGLITKFGGHAMAAGLSLDLRNYDEFADQFDREVKKQLRDDDLAAVMQTDGELASHQLAIEFAQTLREAGPWGQHFPEPLFCGVFKLVQQRIVGEKHLKMVVVPVELGATVEHAVQSIDAIAFNIDTGIWPDETINMVRLAYKLDINVWRNRESLQLLVEHIEPSAE